MDNYIGLGNGCIITLGAFEREISNMSFLVAFQVRFLECCKVAFVTFVHLLSVYLFYVLLDLKIHSDLKIQNYTHCISL